MSEIITEKVAVGISACVFNCPVRYNGRAFDALSLLGRERQDFAWTPVCPECLAGLGVPRMPVHLTGTGQEVLAGTARVRDRRGRDWFLIPDTGLANELRWWDWRRRLHAWLWLERRDVTSSRRLYDAWHVVKFVVQETNRPRADSIGRALAALPKNPSAEQLRALKAEMLDALRAPSSRARIKGALVKAYAHARKSGALTGVDLHGLDGSALQASHTVDSVAADLIRLERVSFENDLLFGPSPVLRRDRKRVASRDAGQAV